MFNLFRRGPTVGEWRAAYLSFARRFSDSTFGAKARAFRRLDGYFPDNTPVRKISKPAVLAMLQRVAQENSGGVANVMNKQLRCGWNWGEQYFALPGTNPFHRQPKFAADERPRYVPPVSDFSAVLDAAETLMDRAMLVLALHTAARRGEIFRLRWADVDFGRKLIQLGTRKRAGGGMQYDWIPMSDALGGILSEYRRETEGFGLVFPRRGHGNECYTSRKPWLRKLCQVAGVKRFGFHSIRHLSASMMAAAGVSIPDIQSVLRHRDIQTTSIYLHRIGAMVGEKLDDVFRSAAMRV